MQERLTVLASYVLALDETRRLTAGYTQEAVEMLKTTQMNDTVIEVLIDSLKKLLDAEMRQADTMMHLRDTLKLFL